MRTLFSALLTSASLVALPAVAQTRKPAPKPVARPAARPVAKPAPAAAPAPRAAAPAPRAAAPAPAPAPAPAARAKPSTGDNSFDVGTNVVNLGIGLGSYYGYSSISPAVSLSYERGIIPVGPGVLGVGVFAGYQSGSDDLLFGSGKWKYTNVIVTLRGAFHYPIKPVPQLDVYGGVGVGVRHYSASYDGNFYSYANSSSNSATIGLFAGGRYYFTPSIGAFAELGYDQTYLKAGLAIKF